MIPLERCPECAGAGRVFVDANEYSTNSRACSRCDGLGELVGRIPIIGMWQPWAQMLVDPDLPKTIETRPKGWPKTIPLPALALIHATERPVDEALIVGEYEVRRTYDADGRHRSRDQAQLLDRSRPHRWSRVLPLGCIVGVVRFDRDLPMVERPDQTEVACIATGDSFHGAGSLDLWPDKFADRWEPVDVTVERPYGDYEPGRHGWCTDGRWALDRPIPWKGAQGFQQSASVELVREVNLRLHEND